MIDTKKLFGKIFLWLFLGLLITFGIGYYVQANENMMYNIFSGGNYIIIWIIEIVLGIVLSLAINKIPAPIAAALYLLYSGLTGLTFGTIFLAYNLESIIWVFGVTSVSMLVLGIFGYTTNLDLTKFGSILFMGLIGLILLSIVSIFVPGINLFLTILSLVIFLGYVAYDIHVIKKQIYSIQNVDNYAIFGAFQLYLDFINLFIDLLRLFGRDD